MCRIVTNCYESTEGYFKVLEPLELTLNWALYSSTVLHGCKSQMQGPARSMESMSCDPPAKPRPKTWLALSFGNGNHHSVRRELEKPMQKRIANMGFMTINHIPCYIMIYHDHFLALANIWIMRKVSPNFETHPQRWFQSVTDQTDGCLGPEFWTVLSHCWSQKSRNCLKKSTGTPLIGLDIRFWAKCKVSFRFYCKLSLQLNH